MIGRQPLIGPDANVGDTVETRAEEIIREVNNEVESKELDLSNLKPKKQNWDLKRDLELKLEKLDRNTEFSIQDLVRRRLAASGQLV
jgi:coiled-coil domain-containing protein 12